MAIQYPQNKILPLEGKRCVVIPPGEEAEICNFSGKVIHHSPGCFFTNDGYPEDPEMQKLLWPGAVPERIHPWPPY